MQKCGADTAHVHFTLNFLVANCFEVTKGKLGPDIQQNTDKINPKSINLHAKISINFQLRVACLTDCFENIFKNTYLWCYFNLKWHSEIICQQFPLNWSL